jgi:hypothetical protein
MALTPLRFAAEYRLPPIGVAGPLVQNQDASKIARIRDSVQ